MTASIRLLPDPYPTCKCGHDRRGHKLLRAVCLTKACGCKSYRPKLQVAR